MQQLGMKSKPTKARKCIMYFQALMCIVGFEFRMVRNRIRGIIQKYGQAGGRNQGSPLKRLLLWWDQSGTTIGPTAWQLYCYYCYYLINW